MYKKRWYDGLNDIYEGKDEFEIKFGCFGGDGNSSGGNTKAPPPPSDPTPSLPNYGYRGEQTATRQTAVEAAKAAVQAEVEKNLAGKAQISQNISNNIAAATSANQVVNNPANQAISDQFSALASAPTSPVSQNVSAVSNVPSVTGFNYSGLNTGVPTGLNIGTPTSTQDVMAQATDVNNNPLGVNIGGFSVAPGMVGNAPGLIGTIDFAKGGVVSQGIGSVFPYPRRR